MAPKPGLEETRPDGPRRARGLVSDPISGARIEARRFKPPPDLAHVVELLWCGSWDLRDQPPHRTELIASPSVNLVFEADANRVVGVWTSLWTRTLEGRGRARAAKLHPGAARAFLHEDARSYTNRMVPLADRFGDADQVAVAVLEPDDPHEGLEPLVRWLRTHLNDPPDMQLAIRIVQRIREQQTTRVDEVAQEAGLSVRALQRLFRTHVGAPPKWVIRWYRLQEAAARVESGAVESLGDLAYELGYADQAHLARDFRAATGKTLTGFEAVVRRAPPV